MNEKLKTGLKGLAIAIVSAIVSFVTGLLQNGGF